MNCPFCKSENVIPISNSQQSHWMRCTECQAAGPHKNTMQEAADAFVIPAPRTATLREKIFGRKEQ